jgi:hypothetical protein
MNIRTGGADFHYDSLTFIHYFLLQDYCLRIDPTSNLGLNTDAVHCYHIADQIVREKGSDLPELLPCGYLVGDNTNVTISLKGKLVSVSYFCVNQDFLRNS